MRAPTTAPCVWLPCAASQAPTRPEALSSPSLSLGDCRRRVWIWPLNFEIRTITCAFALHDAVRARPTAFEGAAYVRMVRGDAPEDPDNAVDKKRVGAYFDRPSRMCYGDECEEKLQQYLEKREAYPNKRVGEAVDKLREVPWFKAGMLPSDEQLAEVEQQQQREMEEAQNQTLRHEQHRLAQPRRARVHAHQPQADQGDGGGGGEEAGRAA
jgi:hypothetical protein